MPAKSRERGKSGKSKANKKNAAVALIQRYGKGWIDRYFYRQFKSIIKSRKRTGKELLAMYREHLQQIMERHNAVVMDTSSVNLREPSDYYIKLEKYELAFDELCGALEKPFLAYPDIPIYFDILSLTPTKAEIRFATEKVLAECCDEYQTFEYTKDIIIDIALHIYVPKGTHLQNTRKSTWLCPIVGNDDALRFELNIEERKRTSLAKCMKTLTISMRGSKEAVPNPPEEGGKRSKKKKVKKK